MLEEEIGVEEDAAFDVARVAKRQLVKVAET